MWTVEQVELHSKVESVRWCWCIGNQCSLLAQNHYSDTCLSSNEMYVTLWKGPGEHSITALTHVSGDCEIKMYHVKKCIIQNYVSKKC